jgi:putative hydrolase of the HAD superfamily
VVKCVIFDLDDTLCDYRGAVVKAKRTIDVILGEAGISASDLFWRKFSEIEPLLFRSFTRKEITRQQYRIHRFSTVIKLWIADGDELASRVNELYMQIANNDIFLFDDAALTLEWLGVNEIYPAILTNGPSDGQREKLASLNLSRYVREIFISEEIGFSKPHTECFNYVLKRLGLRSDEAVMVGDSLEYDIRGAESLNMRAILIDREANYPDYLGEKIMSLTELRDRL